MQNDTGGASGRRSLPALPSRALAGGSLLQSALASGSLHPEAAALLRAILGVQTDAGSSRLDTRRMLDLIQGRRG